MPTFPEQEPPTDGVAGLSGRLFSRLRDLTGVLGLLGAGFLLAYLRFQPHLATSRSYSDGEQALPAGDPALRYAAWSLVGPLAGPAEGGAEHAPAVSPDGRWLVFQAGDRGRGADLFVAELSRSGGGLSRGPARALLGAAELGDELAPAFRGEWLYFAAERAQGLGGLDIFRARFEEGAIGPVETLPPGLNGPDDETDPAPDPLGQGLVFASDRARAAGQGFGLFLAQPILAGQPGDLEFAVESLEVLDSPYDERDPCFSPGGEVLWFASDRAGGAGGFDLYHAARQVAGFGPALLAEGLLSEFDERAPRPLARGFELCFERGEAGKAAGLFWAQSRELFAEPGRPIAWRELLALALLLVLAALAWAARHWRAMDVLYRCYVVSLIVHLALLWWSRGVEPAGSELPSREPQRLAVRLVAAPARGGIERGGELEGLLRTSTLPDPEPTRRQSSEAALEPRGDLAESPAADLSRARPPTQLSSSASALQPPTRSTLPLDLIPIEGHDLAVPERRSLSEPRVEDSGSEALALPAKTRPGSERSDSLLEPRAPSSDRSSETRSVDRLAALSPSGNAPVEPAAARRFEIGELPIQGSQAMLQPSSPSRLEPSPLTSGARPEESADSPSGRRSLAAGVPAAELALGLETPKPSTRKRGGSPGTPLEPEAPPADRRAALGIVQGTELESGVIGAVGPGPSARAPGDLEGSSALGGDFGPGSVSSSLAKLGQLESRPGSEAAARRPIDATAVETESGPVESLEAFAGARLERRRSEPESRVEPEPALIASLASIEPRLAGAIAPGTFGTKRERTSPAADGWRDTPFQARRGSARLEALEKFGGDQRTEGAVDRGLAYLARLQNPAGYWGVGEREDKKYGFVSVGETGLVLLAFLGAGHTASGQSPFAPHVARAIDFLLAVQGRRSGHFGDTGPYSHAIVTYALAEAYALEHDPRLVEPIKRAVAHLLEAQVLRGNARQRGGWGYFYPALDPGERGDDGYSRTSVSAWCVMALESARLSGIEVPDEALEAAHGFFRRAFDPRLGAFRYSHDPSRLGSSWPTLPASTPAAMFVLGLFGEDLEAREWAPARDFIQARAPYQHRRVSDDAFVRRGEGNPYFVYYATLAAFRIGGDLWPLWNTALKDTLLPAQRPDGSWEPICTYALDYAGDTDQSSIYTTALSVLSLEVYYRYFTPLLRVNR